MMTIDFNDYNQEKECTYKDERYSVRDNGAVMRYSREGKRLRPLDNQWTFGSTNKRNGYMAIGSEVVHRIVATAFHGVSPTPNHVVDHIDTNRRNNRPENLRWVTRLENILLNPITSKRIIFYCGSLEEFLADPSQLREDADPKFNWMRTVSKEEARATLERMLNWSKREGITSSGSLGEWVFRRSSLFASEAEEKAIKVSELIISKTPGAAQRKWRVPSEFPCCPQYAGKEPIMTYAENLESGKLFVKNQTYSSMVWTFAVSTNCHFLWILSKNCEEDSIKPWALVEITYENNLYVHTSLSSFFSEEGAKKAFCLAQGLEWHHGDTIDDFC